MIHIYHYNSFSSLYELRKLLASDKVSLLKNEICKNCGNRYRCLFDTRIRPYHISENIGGLYRFDIFCTLCE